MITLCTTCQGTGFVGRSRCGNCRGLAAAALLGGAFLYWGKRIDALEITLDRVRRITSAIISLLLVAVVVLLFGFFVLRVYATNAVDELVTLSFWQTPQLFVLAFWFGALGVLYLITRASRGGDRSQPVQRRAYQKEGTVPALAQISFADFAKYKRADRINVAKTFGEDALRVLHEAFRRADASRHAVVGPAHLLAALLEENRVLVLFGRLGIRRDRVAEPLGRFLEKQLLRSEGTGTVFGAAGLETLFDAYHYAYTYRRPRVGATSLLVSAARHEPAFMEMLFAAGVDEKKLENVAAWIRIGEALRERYLKFRKAAGLRPKGAMNRAMTAQATPELDKVSQDLTQIGKIALLPLLIDREVEMNGIFRVFEGGGRSVVLVGQPGVGKQALVEGVAERMIEEEVPGVLADKRMVVLSVPNLISGVTPAGAQERLLRVLGEVARAGNILLVVPEIHQMVGVSLGEGADLADAFAAELAKGYFLCIGTTDSQSYTQLVESREIGRALERVTLDEMDEDVVIQVLEAKAGPIEYEQKVFFSYDAVAKAVQLSSKYMHERFLPEKAIEVAREAAQKVRAERGERQIVSGEDVAAVVSEKTKIPVTQVTQAESEKLLNLEAEMHGRVIGQDEAVKAVAAALRRARAELREGNRPIANFLFLGPTGVGKTELTKTVAATYFGNEEQMVRLDMSEYQNKDSLSRLIGAPGSGEGGVLTEAIRKQPFTVLLLDELEKAHPDILNVFLQVMDDGRLTDSVGRTIDFTDVILIATSNAGSQVIQDLVRAGAPIETIRQKLITEELRQHYRPEFLNRFDGVIVFKPLGRDEILQIAWLFIGKIQKQLEKKGIRFDVDDAAAEELATAGFDPVFGARPLRRVIQERVQDALANFLLTQKIGRRDTVILRPGGSLEVQKAKEL